MRHVQLSSSMLLLINCTIASALNAIDIPSKIALPYRLLDACHTSNGELFMAFSYLAPDSLSAYKPTVCIFNPVANRIIDIFPAAINPTDQLIASFSSDEKAKEAYLTISRITYFQQKYFVDFWTYRNVGYDTPKYVLPLLNDMCRFPKELSRIIIAYFGNDPYVFHRNLLERIIPYQRNGRWEHSRDTAFYEPRTDSMVLLQYKDNTSDKLPHTISFSCISGKGTFILPKAKFEPLQFNKPWGIYYYFSSLNGRYLLYKHQNGIFELLDCVTGHDKPIAQSVILDQELNGTIACIDNGGSTRIQGIPFNGGIALIKSLKNHSQRYLFKPSSVTNERLSCFYDEPLAVCGNSWVSMEDGNMDNRYSTTIFYGLNGTLEQIPLTPASLSALIETYGAG